MQVGSAGFSPVPCRLSLLVHVSHSQAVDTCALSVPASRGSRRSNQKGLRHPLTCTATTSRQRNDGAGPGPQLTEPQERPAARRFRESNFEKISRTVLQQETLFEASNVTTCFKTLAAVGGADDEAAAAQQSEYLSQLCSLSNGSLSAFKPAQLITILYSCGRLQHHPGPLLGGICQRLHGIAANMTEKQLVLVAWSLAKVQDAPDAHSGALLDAIAAVSAQRVSNFSSQGLTNLVWSYGRLQHPADELLEAIAPQAAARMREFEAQGLCNLLYGCRELQRPLGPELSAAAIEAVGNRLPEFTSQGLSSVLWSLSCFDDTQPVSEELLNGFASQAVDLRLELTALDICDLLGAFARLEFRNQACVDAMCNQALAIANTFERVETVRMLWGLSKLQSRPQALLRKLESTVEKYVQQFQPLELGNVLTSYARLKYTPAAPQLLSSLMQRSQACVGEMNGQCLANVATSLVRLPQLQQTHDLAVGIRAQAIADMGALKPMEVVNLLWALAQLSLASPELCESVVAELSQQLDHLNMRDFTMLVFTLYKARHRSVSEPMVQCLRHAVRAAVQHRHEAPVRQLTTILWGIAGMARGAKAMPPTLAEALLSRLREFNSQDLAFTVVACSKLREVPQQVPQALAAEVEARGVAVFKPHELVDIAGVLSKLGCLPPGLIGQLNGLEECKPARLKKRHISSIQRSIKAQNTASRSALTATGA